MVRRYLRVAVAAVGVGAVLFITSQLLENYYFYRTQPVVIPPIVMFEIEIIAPMYVLGLFLLAVGLILMAVSVKRRGFTSWRRPAWEV